MSFSQEVREELAHLPLDRPCCRRAELAAIVQWNGMLRLSAGGVSLRFDFDNNAVARRVFHLVKETYGVAPELSVVQRRQLNRRHTFRLDVPVGEARQLLLGAGLLREDERGASLHSEVSAALLRRACCRRAYIRGAFLAAGTLTDPEKDYRAEFVAQNPASGRQLAAILERSGFSCRMISRKQASIVYMKGGESLSDLLGVTGAHSALLQVESVRVMKDMRNQVNRVVNCDNANLDRTMNTAARQVEGIRRIIRVKGLAWLSPELRRVAEARLNHPDASLSELVAVLNGEVKKSGVNHRLKRIEELANELNGEERDHD